MVAPFPDFTGGVRSALADFIGDGFPDLVVSPDPNGGPRVRIFSGKDNFAPAVDFFGIDDPNFRGGARVAVGDVNGDGFGDLIVAAGFGGGPRVAGYDGRTLRPGATPAPVFNDFFAFEETLRNGVFIAAGDVDGDGFADVVRGGGPGGGPRVTVLGGRALFGGQVLTLGDFYAGATGTRGGVRVAVRDLNADGRADIVAGSGENSGAHVAAFDSAYLTPTGGTPPAPVSLDFAQAFTGGLVVG